MKYRVPISLWLVENSHRTRFVIKLRFFRLLPRVSSINKDEFVNEKYKFPIFIGINGRMENCSSGRVIMAISTRFYISFYRYTCFLEHFFLSHPIFGRIPEPLRLALLFFLKLIIYLLFSKLVFSLGYLFMGDDLTRAYSQFLTSSSGGMSGGSCPPPPPGPSGSWDPFYYHQSQQANDYQSDPGIAASEGHGRTHRYFLRSGAIIQNIISMIIMVLVTRKNWKKG